MNEKTVSIVRAKSIHQDSENDLCAQTFVIYKCRLLMFYAVCMTPAAYCFGKNHFTSIMKVLQMQ